MIRCRAREESCSESRSSLGAVALAISLAATAVPARAQLPQEEEEPKEYPKVEIAAYVWMPMVASKFDSDRGEVKSYISFSDLLTT